MVLVHFGSKMNVRKIISNDIDSRLDFPKQIKPPLNPLLRRRGNIITCGATHLDCHAYPSDSGQARMTDKLAMTTQEGNLPSTGGKSSQKHKKPH